MANHTGDKKGWYIAFDNSTTVKEAEAYNLALTLTNISFFTKAIINVINWNIHICKHFGLSGINIYNDLFEATRPLEEWRKKYSDELDKLNPNYVDEK